MDKEKKGFSILSYALFSLTLFSISLFSINIYISKERNDKNGQEVAESTVSPEESAIPEPTEAPSTESSPTQIPEEFVPTEAPSTISPTKIPNLTLGKTGGEDKIPKSDLEQYRYVNNDDPGAGDSSADVQSDGDNTPDNNAESSGIENQEKTITVEKSSRLIMMADSGQIANNTGTLTVRRNRVATANNKTVETDEEVLSTEEPDASLGDEEDSEENPDTQEDQTFSITDICNIDSLEINDYTNLVYIYILPGEYTITINDSSTLFDYYMVPDISSLFSDTETVPSDDDPDENQPSETEYDDPSSEE